MSIIKTALFFLPFIIICISDLWSMYEGAPVEQIIISMCTSSFIKSSNLTALPQNSLASSTPRS